MKKGMIFAVIGIVILLLVGIWLTSGSSSPYWETETQFGKFGEEILVEYEDGTTQNLKILMDNENQPFAVVKYNGQQIVGFIYNLYCQAGGSGYTSVNIKWTDMYLTYVFTNNLGQPVYSYDSSKQTSSGSISLGDQGKFFSTSSNLATLTLVQKDKFPTGYYFMLFNPKGTFQYQDPNDNTWKTVSLPSNKQVQIYVQQSAPLATVTLSLTDDRVPIA